MRECACLGAYYPIQVKCVFDDDDDDDDEEDDDDDDDDVTAFHSNAYMGNTYLYSCIHVLIRVFGPRLNTECK